MKRKMAILDRENTRSVIYIGTLRDITQHAATYATDADRDRAKGLTGSDRAAALIGERAVRIPMDEVIIHIDLGQPWRRQCCANGVDTIVVG